MLPRLVYLDEEEVSLLREVGSLYMPRYQSILRRVRKSSYSSSPAAASRPASTLHSSSSSSANGARRPSTAKQQGQRSPTELSTSSHRSPARLATSQADAAGENQAVPERHRGSDETNLLPHSINDDRAVQSSAVVRPENKPETPPRPPPVQRVLIRDASTNTAIDFEKDLLRREQDVVRREHECLARETEVLTQESACFTREKALAAHVLQLQEKLSAAVARVASADAAVSESANQLRSYAASAAADEQQLQEQRQQLSELDSRLTELNESHRRELEQRQTVEANLVRTIDIAQDESRELRQLTQETEREARAKEAAVAHAEAKASELVRSLERTAAEHSAAVQRLTSDVQAYRDRLEQSEWRNAQLETQAKELKTNVQTVYNKCVERDDEIHRLKRALLAKSEDMDDLKTQHAKATARLETMAQQQGDLFRQRLETSVAQVEMEFRKEHYMARSKLQVVQKKHQDATLALARLKDAYELSLQREADAQHEVATLQALLADDKRKLFVEDAQRADAYRVSLEALSSELADVKSQLEAAQAKSVKFETVEAAADELRAANDRLRADGMRQSSEIEALKVLEGDLRAAVKVKDVMLEHAQAQLASLRSERDVAEQHLQDEIAELQGQVEDLELALDESLEKDAGREKKVERMRAQLDEKDRALVVKAQEVDDLAHELSKTHGALELIETEMERLRAALDDQNGLFQRRLERHVEQHHEELERVKVGAEDARERLRIQYEAERRELMQRYAAVASDLKDVAAQNAKLRVSVEAERKRNEQSDQEMRVLLAQVSGLREWADCQCVGADYMLSLPSDRPRAALEERESQAHQVPL